MYICECIFHLLKKKKKKERQVWKRSAQKSKVSLSGSENVNGPKTKQTKMSTTEPSMQRLESIEMDGNDISDALAQFKQIIIRQKEELKYRNEQMAHKEQIHTAAVEQMKKEFTQELQRVKSQSQVTPFFNL
ncbi:hypothetical protein RFI_04755 [Reticulomyxa filosa]|uniref:Uncharacterized protein n=1 Tax=Reticulomyxa filosa TaxID=46433 RepID=X6P465_RETFI|nr:hypothetical protein RFI_04755 [Reticulomyxa filosa]|eukprot:ETO32362.1 hypothetical protein RFI_04755 [Reticulomyxa filosa]